MVDPWFLVGLFYILGMFNMLATCRAIRAVAPAHVKNLPGSVHAFVTVFMCVVWPAMTALSALKNMVAAVDELITGLRTRGK